MAQRGLAGTRAEGRRERRTRVLIDEAAFYLLPGTVRTWAPCGRRPVLRCLKSHDYLSMMSGITPGGEFYTLTRQLPADRLGKHPLPVPSAAPARD